MKKSNSQYLFEAGASKKRPIDAKAKNPFVEKSKKEEKMRLEEIHADARGKINLLTGDMKLDEITVFTTNAGYARGGCIHEINDEYTVIIEGEVLYCIGDKYSILKKGDSCIIPKLTPHYFLSITDSIVLEWGAIPIEKLKKHAKYRQIVDNINAGK